MAIGVTALAFFMTIPLGLALGGLIRWSGVSMATGALVGMLWLFWPYSTRYLLATTPGWRNGLEVLQGGLARAGTIAPSTSLRVKSTVHVPRRGSLLYGDVLVGVVTVGMKLELADGADNLPGTTKVIGYVESAARNKPWVVVALNNPPGGPVDLSCPFSPGTIVSMRELPTASSGSPDLPLRCA